MIRVNRVRTSYFPTEAVWEYPRYSEKSTVFHLFIHRASPLSDAGVFAYGVHLTTGSKLRNRNTCGQSHWQHLLDTYLQRPLINSKLLIMPHRWPSRRFRLLLENQQFRTSTLSLLNVHDTVFTLSSCVLLLRYFHVLTLCSYSLLNHINKCILYSYILIHEYMQDTTCSLKTMCI